MSFAIKPSPDGRWIKEITPARIEMLMLERLVGAGLPVPQLEARGEVARWPYVVMSRLPGQGVPEAWPGLDADARERLAHDIGATMARLAALPVTGLEGLRAPQESLLAERRPRLLQDQRERGCDDALEAQLQAFLDALPPLLPAESVLMHAALTADNILVHDRPREHVELARRAVAALKIRRSQLMTRRGPLGPLRPTSDRCADPGRWR